MIGPSLLVAAGIAAPASPLLQSEPPLERFINGLALLILIFIVGLCLVAFITITAALLPQATERSQAALVRAPWRAFFIGLANYLFLGGISLLLFSTKIGPLGLIGLILTAFLTVATIIGLASLVKLIGERLASLRHRDDSALTRLVWSTVSLELACLLPFIGWFLLTPTVLMVSFGAAVLAWQNRRHPPGGANDDN